jgi:hypothetical protein
LAVALAGAFFAAGFLTALLAVALAGAFLVAGAFFVAGFLAPALAGVFLVVAMIKAPRLGALKQFSDVL